MFTPACTCVRACVRARKTCKQRVNRQFMCHHASTRAKSGVAVVSLASIPAFRRTCEQPSRTKRRILHYTHVSIQSAACGATTSKRHHRHHHPWPTPPMFAEHTIARTRTRAYTHSTHGVGGTTACCSARRGPAYSGESTQAAVALRKRSVLDLKCALLMPHTHVQSRTTAGGVADAPGQNKLDMLCRAARKSFAMGSLRIADAVYCVWSIANNLQSMGRIT